MAVKDTLDERGAYYGSFKHGAVLVQVLKRRVRTHSNWERLASDQREAIEMILHKIGRIVNGNPNYADSWHDIAGYALLIERRLLAEEKK